jgi:cytochrome b involved in lipid metabolism
VVEHPARFGLPEDPSIPIVMVAGGTGISPFRAFILERLRRRDSGECHLYWALRTRHDLYYREELLHFLALGRLRLTVAFSRDDVELVHVPDERGGSFQFRPGPMRRIGDVLLDGENRTRLSTLLRSRSEGGQGAYVYVCGRSRFARSVNDAFRDLFTDLREDGEGPGAFGDRLLAGMVGEGRYMQEIFTDARASVEERAALPISEIVLHNDDEHGYWLVIDGLVYDLTTFIREHPGGVHVLKGYAGMDATQGYLRAHRHRTEIEAMREMYEVGAVRHLDFQGAARKIEIQGVRHTVAVGTFHRLWVQFTYLVVEMQNALGNDQSLQFGVTTRGDPASPRSIYKLERAIETHERFLRSSVDGILGDSLSALFELARPMCSSGLAPAWLDERLSDTRAARNALYVEDLTRSMKRRHQLLVDEQPTPDSSGYLRLVEAIEFLERQDAGLLTRAKELLRGGLLLFERHGAAVLEAAGAQLFELVLGIPELVESYFAEVYSYRMTNGWAPSVAPVRAVTRTVEESNMRITVLSSDFWLMEEDQVRKVVVLKRSAQPVEAIDDLILANRNVIAKMRPDHADYGVVVDMRQAPSRNDPEFEDAMRLLRLEVSKHFARVAVLVTSAVGVLQVARMSRNEGAETFATQDELAAMRFAQGG